MSDNDDTGFHALLAALTERLDAMAAPGLAPSERQRSLLASARETLQNFEATSNEPEVLSERLRAAARRLEELPGRIAPDDILDDIFSSFCIGK